MNFNLPSINDPHAQHNAIHHTNYTSSSSTYTTIQAGFPNGNFGGGCVGSEMFRGGFEMRQEIERELEKERIRAEIIAGELARRRALEEEVRNELRMEAMRSAGESEFPSHFVTSHVNLFEPRSLHQQPTSLEERIVMSIDQRYARGDHRGFPVLPFQRFGDLPKITGSPKLQPKDTKKELIVLGKPNGETLSGTKRKATPLVAECSSKPRAVSSKKKVKEEWSCAICQVSATSERGLKEHVQGKKHQTKEAALIAQKTGANFGLGVAPKKPIVKPAKLALTTVSQVDLSSTEKNNSKSVTKYVTKTPEMIKSLITSDSNDTKKEDEMKIIKRRNKFKFWCEMCQVGVYSEKVMNKHKKGKKHLAHVVEQLVKGKVETEASATDISCDIEEKTVTETMKTVDAELIADEEKTNIETKNTVVVAMVADEEKTDIETKNTVVIVMVTDEEKPETETSKSVVKPIKDVKQDVTLKEADSVVAEDESKVKTLKEDIEDVTAEKADTVVADTNDTIKTAVVGDASI